MNYYVGIGMGTSAVKLLLMDEAGMVCAQSSFAYDYMVPQSGWSEMDPAVWMEAVDQGMTALLRDFADDARKAVAGIGVTGQMHTTVFLDAAGNSIRPAIMWNDTRTLPFLKEIRQRIEAHEEVSYIAKIISTGSPAMNLYWLKQQEPENFSRVKKFLIGPDYMVYRLSGFMGTDYCEASTSSLYDLYKHRWSLAMREVFGFPEDVYPPVNGSSVVVGTVQREWAQRWGLSSEAAIVAGTGDNPAAAYANGVNGKSPAVLSLGTSGVLVFSRDQLDFAKKGKNIAFSADGKDVRYLAQGVLQSVGRTMQWWEKGILQNPDFETDLQTVDLAGLGESELLFYPHLTGDKTIYHDVGLRGAFLGLSAETRRIDMEIAIMEGVAFGVKELIEKMDLSREKMNPLRVTGGGARNKIWMQILADVLGMPVEQLKGNASAAYGAALLARGKGRLPVLAAAAGESCIFRPRLKNAVLYRKKYRHYQKIHDAVKTIFSV